MLGLEHPCSGLQMTMLHFRVLFQARPPPRRSWKRLCAAQQRRWNSVFSSLRGADSVCVSHWPGSTRCSADSTCLNRAGTGWWVWKHVDRHVLKGAHCLIHIYTAWRQCNALDTLETEAFVQHGNTRSQLSRKDLYWMTQITQYVLFKVLHFLNTCQEKFQGFEKLTSLLFCCF